MTKDELRQWRQANGITFGKPLADGRLDPGARALLWALLLAAGLWVVLAAIWSSF